MKFNPFNTSKILVHSDKMEAILRGEIPSPVTVEIDPADTCNDSCYWCMYDEMHTKSVLPEGDLIKLIEELSESEVKSVTFTGGGEPLMNRATPRAIEYASKKGLQVGLVSNGGLLGKNLEKLGSLKFLRLSLDAGEDQTYIMQHRPKNNDPRELSNIFSAVSEYKAMYPNVTVGAGFVVNENNFREVEEFARRAANAKIDYVQIRPCLVNEKSREYLNIVVEEIPSIRDRNDIEIYGMSERFNIVRESRGHLENCLSTPLVGVVQASGDIALCCQKRYEGDTVIGNIKDGGFFKHWGSEKHRDILKNIDVKNCPVCRYIPYNEAIANVVKSDKMHKDFL